MRERIKQIIKKEGLQISDFADKIHVSRGTISHILNGRMINGVRIYNDPSKDTIDKILKVFPDISSSWFLIGEGPMYKHERVFMRPISLSSTIQPDLFDENITVESSVKSHEDEYSQENKVKKPDNKTISTIIQDVNLSKIPSKKIDKIMIFFSDKTFMTFIPEE
jgi:transcriptional regulator with XRE-family HTH domain